MPETLARPRTAADHNADRLTPTPARAAAPRAEGHRPAALRVAVVDDDPAAAATYPPVLARLGHEACVVAARDLADFCRAARPDAVVVAAGRIGEDVALARAVVQERPVPFVLVTDGGLPASASDALADPFYGCLTRAAVDGGLGPAVALAARLFGLAQAERRGVADLRRQLEDRKVVERAKGAAELIDVVRTYLK